MSQSKEQQNNKPNLYVGCALTHAPADFREDVDRLKAILEDDWNVMKFLGLVDGTSGDVYEKDINENVRSCDAFLAVADHPATGLGWELGVADERETPTLIVMKFNASVTRLVIGAPERRDHIALLAYKSLVEDVPGMVTSTLTAQMKLRGKINISREVE